MPELCYLVHVTWHQVIPSVLMRPKWPGIYATVPGCVVEMLKNCTHISLVQKYSHFLVMLSHFSCSCSRQQCCFSINHPDKQVTQKQVDTKPVGVASTASSPRALLRISSPIS